MTWKRLSKTIRRASKLRVKSSHNQLIFQRPTKISQGFIWGKKITNRQYSIIEDMYKSKQELIRSLTISSKPCISSQKPIRTYQTLDNQLSSTTNACRSNSKKQDNKMMKMWQQHWIIWEIATGERAIWNHLLTVSRSAWISEWTYWGQMLRMSKKSENILKL